MILWGNTQLSSSAHKKKVGSLIPNPASKPWMDIFVPQNLSSIPTCFVSFLPHPCFCLLNHVFHHLPRGQKKNRRPRRLRVVTDALEEKGKQRGMMKGLRCCWHQVGMTRGMLGGCHSGAVICKRCIYYECIILGDASDSSLTFLFPERFIKVPTLITI